MNSSQGIQVAYSDVSNILWRERQLLELLQFKLEVEQSLLASGRSRWLGHATREIEMLIEEVKQVELARAIEVRALCDQLGINETPTLKALVAELDEPWSAIFEDHRQAFLTATQEIVGLAETNRELLARGYQAAREALASLGAERVETYGPSGMQVSRSGRDVRLLDEVM
ncbi:flagellar protein FlgN [Euzebya sp.]|uniref:flagellar protein FlgN n=1 Tax=Euzebya sp. TaxID=1971409 RepID=UPI0035144EF3